MRMRKWAAYLLCFLSLALLGISGHFLADYAKQPANKKSIAN